MNPVIGLDVSKGESQAQGFLDRGVPHVNTFRFGHNLEGLLSFPGYAQTLESFISWRLFYEEDPPGAGRNPHAPSTL